MWPTVLVGAVAALRAWLAEAEMKSIQHWIPVMFCAFISALTLGKYLLHAGENTWAGPILLAFLPMCFYFVGPVPFRMQRELTELRQKVGELEQRRAG